MESSQATVQKPKREWSLEQKCRAISLHTLQLKLNGVNPGDVLNLRLYPLNAATVELRCWRKHTLMDVRILKNTDLKGVHF